MTSRCRQPAWITNRRRVSGLCCLLIVLLPPLPLLAAQAERESPALRPYTAHYRTTARGFDLDITRTLEADAADHFILTNSGKILVVGFHEISVFRLQEGRIRSISYVYQGTGLVNRRRELHFEQEPGAITSLYKNAWYELPYAPQTLDRMSQVEQLRLELMADAPPADTITLQVADGKRVKDSRLVLVGAETLQIPLGEIDTLHYQRLHDDAQRTSDIWLAPEWDYLMVKTLHVEDGDPVEMLLTSATLDGQAVSLN